MYISAETLECFPIWVNRASKNLPTDTLSRPHTCATARVLARAMHAQVRKIFFQVEEGTNT